MNRILNALAAEKPANNNRPLPTVSPEMKAVLRAMAEKLAAKR